MIKYYGCTMLDDDYLKNGLILIASTTFIFILGIIVGYNLHKPTTTPKTAVDIVNYTCTTFDDLTIKCDYNGRG